MEVSRNIDLESDHSGTYVGRVEELLEQRGCSKSWLAKKLGISRQALNNVLKYNKNPKYVSEIAIILDVSPNWLLYGQQDAKRDMRLEDLITHLPTYRLNDFIKLETSAKVIDRILYKKKENEADLIAIIFDDSPSMNGKFENESILIFDKSKTPINGDYVLAKIDNKIMLRQFYRENDTAYFKPHVHGLPILESNNFIILGTLIETRTIL